MRKITILVVLLLIFSVSLSGCFFSSTTTTTDESEPADMVVLDLTIDGQGDVAGLTEGENKFDKSSVVDLEAESDEDWEFRKWIGDVDSKYNKETSIVMDQDKTLSVVFKEKEEPAQEVDFSAERVRERRYKFTATEPADSDRWEWRFDDQGGNWDVHFEPTTSRTFDTAGEKLIELRIRDSDGDVIGYESRWIDVY